MSPTDVLHRENSGPGRKSRRGEDDDGDDDDDRPAKPKKERRGRPKKAKTEETVAAVAPATAAENPAAAANADGAAIGPSGDTQSSQPTDNAGLVPMDVVPKEQAVTEGSENADGTPGKKQRQKKEHDPNHLLGKWTDDEETKFLEALTNFGRDWDAVRSFMTSQ
jgi:hypothetical protein